MDILASFTRNIKLGHTGENEAARVAFSLVPFKEEFPGGRPALLVKPPKGGNAYPVALTVKGDTAYWPVTAADTAVAGFGQCELQWYAGDTLAKSDKFDFWVVQALEAGAEPPDAPSKRWFDAIQSQIGNLDDLTTEEKKNLVAAINEAARSGGGSGGAGTIDMRVADGYIQYSNDDGATWENLIAIADLKGADGKNGITPTIGANGNWYLGDEDTGKPSRGATGSQGADGKDGTNGTDGTDGHTPVITASKSGKVTTIKVDGEAVATVNDGADGTNGTDGAPGKDGADGAPGKDGSPGKDGVTPDIKIGTVTTLPAGSAATASMGGTAAQPTLNLGIPKGADGDNANITKDAVVGALGFTPISADDVPVKSVNGATGAVKSTFHVTVTPTGSGYAATADKTAAEVYEAYAAGYAVYAVVKFASVAAPFELPLVAAASALGTIILGFGALGSLSPTAKPQYPTVSYTGTEWMAWLGTLARSEDIPTIPTELKNPHSLNIKIGNVTTSYDGSAAKTVTIPEGGGADASLGITGAAAGEFPKVSAVNENGAPTSWETVESEEVTLGGDIPAPTDAQVSSAVNTWLTEHPEATTTVQDGSVSVEKLGYGKHIYGSKPYFCNSAGSGAVSYGSIGVVVPCKAGDTIYCNFNMSPNGAYQKPQLLAALPENQYGAIAPIGTIEKDDTTKAYTVPASATTAKAMYLPQSFNAIPAANNGSVEDALAWINKTMGTDGKWCAQNVPFEDYDAWYQTAQAELFDIDERCNKLMYASLYQAVSKLVGAKVAVLGDSLTEQSACSFITSAYNDRWMENVLRDTALTGDDGKTYKGSGWFALIARKYKIKWWCAGHGAQWWYSTTERPNGATAMVRKLIDGTDEFDYIVLEYGTNDILSGYTHIGTAADEASETATTSCGAIKWCIEQLQTRFPEASIVVILPNIRSGANGESPAMQQTYLDTVVPILKKYGVRRVNMAEDSGIVKSMMSTDGVHLRWPVVSNNVTHYTNDTPAVRKFSKCLESVLLQA